MCSWRGIVSRSQPVTCALTLRPAVLGNKRSRCGTEQGVEIEPHRGVGVVAGSLWLMAGLSGGPRSQRVYLGCSRLGDLEEMLREHNSFAVVHALGWAPELEQHPCALSPL